jgi:hypothetical protein
LIFEIEKWAEFLSENDKKMALAFDQCERAENYEEAGHTFFEFEKYLLNFAFFFRRLIEEAEVAVASEAKGGNFDDLICTPEDIVDLGLCPISLPGSIGPKFRSSQSFDLTVKKLCHQIIHHSLLNLGWPRPGDKPGFYVSSDRDSSKRIYFVDLGQLSECIDRLKAIATTNEGAP